MKLVRGLFAPTGRRPELVPQQTACLSNIARRWRSEKTLTPRGARSVVGSRLLLRTRSMVMAFRVTLLFAVLLEIVGVLPVVAQEQIPASIYEQAVGFLDKGKPAQAERTLQAALREHPRDAQALGLMGVTLDAQQRYDEAERYYNQALEIEPHSASLLNNLGNHYMARGDTEKARTIFKRVITFQPAQVNANLQLARISVEEKKGSEALTYLYHLPPQDQAIAVARLFRAQALDLQGKRSEAVNVLAELERQSPRDSRVAFSIGMIYASWKRYEDAERAFMQALETDPANFDVLYNLGLAAMRAGDLDRAREVFGVALKRRPEDVDTLYNLGRVRSEQGNQVQAVELLARAHHLAPQRPEILLLMAQTAEKLGYYKDTATALDQYLKLRPKDEVARRERAFALACTGQLNEALPDLRLFVQEHPNDAPGQYELGMAETIHDRNQAIKHFSRALEVAPNFDAARYARAVLNFQAGKYSQAVEDLKLVLRHSPENYSALDILGESYLQLGRLQEAANTLGQAAKRAPNNTKVLIHYSRALLRAGRQDEATAVLHKLEQLGPDAQVGRSHSGLLDFLNLPPARQRAQYLANIEGRIRMKPRDPALRVLLGKELLADGKTAQALQAFQQVLTLRTEPKMLADCGKALLKVEQYDAAREFLQRVINADPSDTDARLDLAIAVFHISGPAAGLAELEKLPATQRRGDYFLLQAQMLDAQGKEDEARVSLNRGLRSAPTRPDLYFQAALFLIKYKRFQRAVTLLQQALQLIPNEPKLMLTEAVAYGLMDRPEESRKIIADIESRWPEWSKPYLIEGIILSGHAKFSEAKPILETAVALGSDEPAAYYNLALANIRTTPPDIESAHRAIEKALILGRDDPYIQSLAGKIAYQQKDYQAALDHLDTALRLWPDMVEAHETLSATYLALGNRQKSAAELKDVLRIKQQIRTPDQKPPFSPDSLLFSVHARQP
jgi:Flp pilus assembly protein TadD